LLLSVFSVNSVADMLLRMRQRVAIVEDDPAIRANYADVLRKQGYEVAAYGDRSEALAALRTRSGVVFELRFPLAG
jgi:DNA-binding response OmpR family regulator